MLVSMLAGPCVSWELVANSAPGDLCHFDNQPIDEDGGPGFVLSSALTPSMSSPAVVVRSVDLHACNQLWIEDHRLGKCHISV